MKLKDIKKLDTPALRYGTVPKALMKYRNLIIDADKAQDGYTFGLRNGFICTLTETHQIMEDTVERCLSSFEFVEPCDGDCCKDGNE